jgi:hypothetical protein
LFTYLIFSWRLEYLNSKTFINISRKLKNLEQTKHHIETIVHNSILHEKYCQNNIETIINSEYDDENYKDVTNNWIFKQKI